MFVSSYSACVCGFGVGLSRDLVQCIVDRLRLVINVSMTFDVVYTLRNVIVCVGTTMAEVLEWTTWADCRYHSLSCFILFCSPVIICAHHCFTDSLSASIPLPF